MHTEPHHHHHDHDHDRRIADAIRSRTDQDGCLTSPPNDLWDRIARAIDPDGAWDRISE